VRKIAFKHLICLQGHVCINGGGNCGGMGALNQACSENGGSVSLTNFDHSYFNNICFFGVRDNTKGCVLLSFLIIRNDFRSSLSFINDGWLTEKNSNTLQTSNE
jgi:hypothetical protein